MHCNGTRPDRQDHPVNCVDWFQARAYCAFVNKRLPSEAEWEYAARGGDGRLYPWGNEPPTAHRLNACDVECQALGKRMGQRWPAMYQDSDGWGATAPIGSFPAGASPFGALDMAGNVWEWTADWFDWYQPGDATNPLGAPRGSKRVNRGGGWTNGGDREMRSASRSMNSPTYHDLQTGFRCAR
jgi:formylglycine-generating enzyme required for sulfatase activity